MKWRQVGIAGAALTLLAVGVGPLVVSASVDSSEHVRLLGMLRELSTLEARLGENLLQSRLGQTRSYDALVEIDERFARVIHDLEASIAVEGETAGLARDLGSYRTAHEERRDLVERFKSERSVFSNSVRYLPLAAEAALHEERATGARRGAEAIEGVLVRTLALMNEFGTQEGDLDQAVAQLGPASGAGATDALIRHADMAGSKKAAVDDLLVEIQRHQAGDRLKSLHAAYSAHYQRLGHRSEIFQRALYGLALLLGGAVAGSLYLLQAKSASLADLNRGLEETIRSRSAQLAQAQKLESIGSLAAGIAHEINTPAQYVGDNLRFLSESYLEAVPLWKALGAMVANPDGEPAALLRDLRESVTTLDFPFLADEVPGALLQSQDGIARVSEIVRAMKEFSHPGSDQPEAFDVNRAIKNTVTVAKNEWKYVAEVALELDESLPMLMGHLNSLSQAFLNLIVNAAHAIGEQRGESGGKGTITIRTRKTGASVEIEFADDGPGIPEAIRERVFDPFFTTKQVGKGTGQGLTIARSTIVDKHGGTFELESEVGKGTTFRMRLPLVSPSAEQGAPT